jgi:hypothetical protein
MKHQWKEVPWTQFLSAHLICERCGDKKWRDAQAAVRTIEGEEVPGILREDCDYMLASNIMQS